MNRWIRTGLAALSAGLLAAGAQAQETTTLKYADQFPLTHPASRLSAQPFEEKVEARSDGRIQIEHYPAEQLAKAAGMLDAVKNRVTDLAMVGIVYVTDRMPLTSAVELPGVLSDAVAGSRVFTELAKNELLEMEYLRNDVRPLFGVVTPPYQFMFAEPTEIEDISDLKGEKLRVAGATGELIARAIGATPVRVPASDLYLALDRGTVDGAIFNPPSLFGYNIQEVLSGVSTNASLGTVAFALLVNEDVWQGLPQEARALLSDVALEVGAEMAAAFQRYTEDAYGRLDELGIELIELSPQVRSQMDERLGAVHAEWLSQMEDRGLPGERILEAVEARAAD